MGSGSRQSVSGHEQQLCIEQIMMLTGSFINEAVAAIAGLGALVDDEYPQHLRADEADGIGQQQVGETAAVVRFEDVDGVELGGSSRIIVTAGTPSNQSNNRSVRREAHKTIYPIGLV